MAESNVPPAAAFDGRAVQFAQTQALAASTSTNEANNSSFLAAISQASEGDAPNNNAQPALTEAELNAAEGAGLLSLSSPALSVLNEFGSDPRTANITGNLTTQQLQSLGVLQEDAARLEAAGALSVTTPLTGAATTVDLSVQGQDVADGILPASQIAGNATLSTQQLQQLGNLLAPLANQPLTQPLFLQIQAQVANAGFSPLQFSLRTIFLVLQYIGGLLPPSDEAVKAAKTEVIAEEAVEVVMPATSVDAVATEDMAIR